MIVVEIDSTSYAFTQLRFWCVGCQRKHRIVIVADPKEPEGAVWDWNGDEEHPTATPSINNVWYLEDEVHECHLNMTNGQLIYFGECTHGLSGQTVDMVPIPEPVLEESEV